MWLLNGTLENTFFELHTQCVNALVALPDNQHALSGAGLVVKLFNVNDGVALRTFTHHIHYVFSLALLPGGRRFISGSKDGTARIVEHGPVQSVTTRAPRLPPSPAAWRVQYWRDRLKSLEAAR